MYTHFIFKKLSYNVHLNLKSQCLPVQCCFILNMPLKVCFGQATYFPKKYDRLILQTLISGKSQPNQATPQPSVNVYLSIHKIILKSSKSLNLSQILAPDGGQLQHEQNMYTKQRGLQCSPTQIFKSQRPHWHHQVPPHHMTPQPHNDSQHLFVSTNLF